MLDAKKQAWLNGELSAGEWLYTLLAEQTAVVSFMLRKEGDAGEAMMERVLGEADFEQPKG